MLDQNCWLLGDAKDTFLLLGPWVEGGRLCNTDMFSRFFRLHQSYCAIN